MMLLRMVVNFTARRCEAHEGGKLTPEIISHTAKVPCFNHFVAQEARECCSYGY